MEAIPIECYMVSGNIGCGTRFIRVLFSDGERAVVLTSTDERHIISCSSIGSGTIKPRGDKFKLEAGRFFKRSGDLWVDMFPIKRYARKDTDKTVRSFLANKAKKMSRGENEFTITPGNAMTWESPW